MVMASALLSKLIIEHTHYFSEVKQTRARGRHALESIGDRQDRFAIERGARRFQREPIPIVGP